MQFILLQPEFKDSKIEKISIDTNTIDNKNTKHKKNDFKPLHPITESSVTGVTVTIVPLDEDIVQSVSQLESVITKTIENTEKIKDLGSGVLEPILGGDTKKKATKKFGSSGEMSKTSTIYNINLDKSKEEIVLIDDFVAGEIIDMDELTTIRLPEFQLTRTTTANPVLNPTTTTTGSTSTDSSILLSTTTITPININSYNSIYNNNHNNNNNSMYINPISSSSSTTLSLISTTTTTETSNQKLVNLEQSTLSSTVTTTTKVISIL